MSDINLLPEDLKKREEKTLKDRGNFDLNEIEFTEGEKIKKETDVRGKISRKNKLEKWLKPKVKSKLEFKEEYNKVVNTNFVPKIKNKQKEFKEEISKKEIKIPEVLKNISKLSKKELKREKVDNLNNIKEIKVSSQKGKKELDKKKKSSNSFKNLFSRISSKTKKEKKKPDKKEESFNVNLLPFGFNVPTTRRMLSILIITFILSVSLVFIVYFGYFIYKNRIVDNYSSLRNELDSYMEEIKKYDDLMQETSSWQEKVTEIEHLLNKHIYWTKFFEKLEKNTLPNVQFIGFAGSIDGSIILNAIAPDYQTVSKQWIRLQDADDFIKKVEISSADMTILEDDINISFSLILDFVDNIFYNE